MSSLFGFSAPADIDVRLEGEHERQHVDVKLENQPKDMLPLYHDGDTVKGTVVVLPRIGKKLQHDGIKIEMIGSIGASYLTRTVL